MLVSHRHRFIFTKTAKSAGTSVEGYFERFCLPDGDFVPTDGRPEYESASGIVGYRGPSDGVARRWFNHMPAAAIRRELGEAVWHSYFKFCTVRDPFERAISAFEHLGRDYVAPFTGLRRKLGWPPSERERFRHWLTWRGLPNDRPAYMIDGALCVDDVIRYENLDAEMARICAKIGVPWQPELMPRFKSQYRRPEATVASLYSPAAIRIVARACRREIALFDYPVPTAGRGRGQRTGTATASRRSAPAG